MFCTRFVAPQICERKVFKLKKMGGEKTLQNIEVADEAFRDPYVLHTFCRAPNLLRKVLKQVDDPKLEEFQRDRHSRSRSKPKAKAK